MLKVLGNRNIVLAKEITKIHEYFYRDRIENIISELEKEERIRGEFVILVEGSEVTKKEKEKEDLLKLPLEEHYKYYENQGLTKKEIIKKIAKDRNMNKNEVYQKFI